MIRWFIRVIDWFIKWFILFPILLGFAILIIDIVCIKLFGVSIFDYLKGTEAISTS